MRKGLIQWASKGLWQNEPEYEHWVILTDGEKNCVSLQNEPEEKDQSQESHTYEFIVSGRNKAWNEEVVLERHLNSCKPGQTCKERDTGINRKLWHSAPKVN